MVKSNKNLKNNSLKEENSESSEVRKVGRPKAPLDRFGLRCKATSTGVWRKGPDSCYLCNACGQQYRKLSNYFNEYRGDIKYLVHPDPFPKVTSIFMLDPDLSIIEIREILLDIFKAMKENSGTFTINIKKFILVFNGYSFSLHNLSNKLIK
ncbi:hypothetical protein DICPUDRAFT_80812 [Dictyostelium purpureum]|uniref:GATA-type domain-containing protein n=1 Tax=Dictyostelium purpureum TaxID=5786 RepID=F0ZRL6_DICPU|nr:uncharacterized protein DICPUDRAFT_80812 [Dictyostelium purpureum]EGC33403.1 hypothetical protein DICPUDRAFT_80812 [Dictyostelium purpureum]|eukprot:XP_003290067.1 hypothetical protein DICPUDRAFT_80812 [Dictyostelium purpureum]